MKVIGGEDHVEFKGLWDICEVKIIKGDSDGMETQSFIKIDDVKKARFQFGQIMGDLAGEIVEQGSSRKFMFKWLGMDNIKMVNGSGWIEIMNKDFIEGEIIFYNGKQWKIKAKKNKFI